MSFGASAFGSAAFGAAAGTNAHKAPGFTSTNVGTPGLSNTNVVLTAAGAATTAFGTPRAYSIYACDDFRGSGVLHGSVVKRHAASVGTWISVLSAGTVSRSAGGLSVALTGTGGVGTISPADSGSAIGEGVWVVEAKVYGPLDLTLQIGSGGGGVSGGISLNASGKSYSSYVMESGVPAEIASAAGSNPNFSTATVLRIEATATGFAAFVNGAAAGTHTWSTTLTTASLATATGIAFNTGALPNSTITLTVADYINAVKNTASGALGPPDVPGAVCAPTGFSSTAVGSPHAAWTQFGNVTGVYSTAVGSPRWTNQCLAWAIAPTTVVPMAYVSHTVVAVPEGVRGTLFGTPFNSGPKGVVTGFRSTNIGTPFYSDPFPHPVAGIPDGFSSTGFGAPASPYAQALQANGFGSTQVPAPRAWNTGPSTAFGTPTASFGVTASGFIGTMLGTPILAYNATAIVPGTMLGTPNSTAPFPAAAIAPRTAFGMPAAFLGGRKAYGFTCSGRLGQPMSYRRINRSVSAWSSSTMLGTPLARDIHLVPAIPPMAQFGTATLKRIPAC